MKNKILLAFLIGATAVLSPLGVLAAKSDNAVHLKIEGKAAQVPDPQPFIDAGGRTLVPLRFVSEALGYKVDWKETEKTAVITKESTIVELKLGDKNAKVNGKAVTLDASADAVNERMFVPLRFVMDAFNREIKWDAASMTADIRAKAAVKVELKELYGVYKNGESTYQTYDANEAARIAKEDPAALVYNITAGEQISGNADVPGTQPGNGGGAANGKVIVIDPGHGGKDPGAKGIDGKTTEAAVNLAFGMAVRDELRAKGYQAVMIREKDQACDASAPDTSHELQCRVDAAKKEKADIYVSIHSNWNYSVYVKGTEVWYNETNEYDGHSNPFPAESKKLAATIHKYVQPSFGSDDRGVKNSNFYVNRMNTVPACLVEVGFMSNKDDLAKLKDNAVIQKFAKSFGLAIDEYFSS